MFQNVTQRRIINIQFLDGKVGRSVGIVRSRTKGHGVCLFLIGKLQEIL
jgi:hypothetical protein